MDISPVGGRTDARGAIAAQTRNARPISEISRPLGRLFSYTPAAGGNRCTHRACRESRLAHARAGGNLSKGNEMADEATKFEPITSQEQLDGILEGRLVREREKVSAKYADYDGLKAKAAKFDEAEAAQMSDLEKAKKEVEELRAAAKRDEADRVRDLKASFGAVPI